MRDFFSTTNNSVFISALVRGTTVMIKLILRYLIYTLEVPFKNSSKWNIWSTCLKGKNWRHRIAKELDKRHECWSNRSSKSRNEKTALTFFKMKYTSSLMAQVESAKTLIFGAIAILFLTTYRPPTFFLWVANRLDTELTTTYARWLEGREMTAGQHFIWPQTNLSAWSETSSFHRLRSLMVYFSSKPNVYDNELFSGVSKLSSFRQVTRACLPWNSPQHESSSKYWHSMRLNLLFCRLMFLLFHLILS